MEQSVDCKMQSPTANRRRALFSYRRRYVCTCKIRSITRTASMWLLFQYRKRYGCTCKYGEENWKEGDEVFQYRKRYGCTCKGWTPAEMSQAEEFQYRKRYGCTCKSARNRCYACSYCRFNTASGMDVHVRLSPAALENTGLRNGFLRLPAFGADFVK